MTIDLDLLLDNLANASKDRRFLDGGDLRELVVLNIIEPIFEEFTKRLRRADPVCENMHHDPHEYHKAGQPCPVIAWVRNGLDEQEKS